MSEIYLAKSDLTGAIYAVNDKSKTNVTDFVVELIKIETEAQAARIRQLEEIVERIANECNHGGVESVAELKSTLDVIAELAQDAAKRVEALKEQK